MFALKLLNWTIQTKLTCAQYIVVLLLLCVFMLQFHLISFNSAHTREWKCMHFRWEKNQSGSRASSFKTRQRWCRNAGGLCFWFYLREQLLKIRCYRRFAANCNLLCKLHMSFSFTIFTYPICCRLNYLRSWCCMPLGNMSLQSLLHVVNWGQ